MEGYWKCETQGIEVASFSLARAVEAVTGEPPIWSPHLNSDAFAFLRAGIPAATLGGYDRDLGQRGLHSALDTASRVDPVRLVEAADLLCHLLKELDSAGSCSEIEVSPSPACSERRS